MNCFMCFSSHGKLQIFEGAMDNDTFKRITFVLPDFIIPESQDPLYICPTCLEQVLFFYTIKEASLQNSCRLKQFNALLKGTNNFKYNELSIKIKSEEITTEFRHHINIKVELNHEDLFLSEDTDPTHAMTKDKEYNFHSQQLVNDETSLNHLQDDSSSCGSYNSTQKHIYSHVEKFNKTDSNLTSTTSLNQDKPKTQHESQKKKFKCSDCRREFSKPSDLKIHIRVHTGEKPYNCSICQKTFSRSYYLKRHKLTHTDGKPHECDVCNKTFKRKSNLRSHKRFHSNVRPYKCGVCNKAFKLPGNLNTHMLIHTGNKRHQCHLCEYKSVYAGDLKRHIKIHKGEKPYSCKYCNKSFSLSNNLKQHERNVHSNENSK